MFIPGFPLDSYFDLSFSYDREWEAGEVEVGEAAPPLSRRYNLQPPPLLLCLPAPSPGGPALHKLQSNRLQHIHPPLPPQDLARLLPGPAPPPPPPPPPPPMVVSAWSPARFSTHLKKAHLPSGLGPSGRAQPKNQRPAAGSARRLGQQRQQGAQPPLGRVLRWGWASRQ